MKQGDESASGTVALNWMEVMYGGGCASVNRNENSSKKSGVRTLKRTEAVKVPVTAIEAEQRR